MIVTTESIVLRARKQGDSSKIIALYTREFGLLSVIAKGARQMKSPFGATLELFNHISAIFYKKGGRDLHFLSKADTIKRMDGIQRSLEQLTAASKIAELVIRSMHGEHEHAALFDLLLRTLDRIAIGKPTEAPLFLIYFYYHFVMLEGFALNVPAEMEAGRSYAANISSGNVVPVNTDSNGITDHRLIPLSGRSVEALNALKNNTITDTYTTYSTDELEHFFLKYLQTHIDSFRPVQTYYS